MGTVVTRERKDGSSSYMAKIILKTRGKIKYRESQTFDREGAARNWLKTREAALKKPGGIEQAQKGHVTLADAINTYLADPDNVPGKSKKQVLKTISKMDIGHMHCIDIASKDIIDMARTIGESAQPQTVANYMGHLAAVFTVARPAWGLPLDSQAIKDAFVVARRMRLVSKSVERNRRPEMHELDALMTHFIEIQTSGRAEIPMEKLLAFALFSTRRQNEITRLRWDDLDVAKSRILVRDMKNPGQTRGNHVLCDLPAPCLRIIAAMPRTSELIFPFNGRSASASFTRACALLGVEDLHFHDLRHEGISRLFEMGWAIPNVAQVSGHRSWVALKRYTRIDGEGDRFKGWKWLDIIAPD